MHQSHKWNRSNQHQPLPMHMLDSQKHTPGHHSTLAHVSASLSVCPVYVSVCVQYVRLVWASFLPNHSSPVETLDSTSTHSKPTSVAAHHIRTSETLDCSSAHSRRTSAKAGECSSAFSSVCILCELIFPRRRRSCRSCVCGWVARPPTAGNKARTRAAPLTAG